MKTHWYQFFLCIFITCLMVSCKVEDMNTQSQTPAKPDVEGETVVQEKVAEAIKTAPIVSKSSADELVILDFNSGSKPNNLGGDLGAWDKDPADKTQTCEIEFEYGMDAKNNPDGFALKIMYDVDSPNPAYNGFWTKLEGEDFSQYDTLVMYVKGDDKARFTSRFKIEIKNFNATSPYLIKNVNTEWQRYEIPFEDFNRIKDWTTMNEFVIVFDDQTSNPKEGIIYIDEISVVKKNT